MSVRGRIRLHGTLKASNLAWSLVGQGFRKVRETARYRAEKEWLWTNERVDLLCNLENQSGDKVRLRIGATATRIAIYWRTTAELLYGAFLFGLFAMVVVTAVFTTSVADLRKQNTAPPALW